MMKTKRLSFRGAMAGIVLIGVLLVGTWALSSPRSTTADALLLYSPIPPIGDPVFNLSKAVDNPAPVPGDIIEYTVTYANAIAGSQGFRVRLYDFLPAGVQYLSADPVPDSASGGVLVYNFPSLGPTTASSQITVQARVLEGFERLYNHALIYADGVLPAQALLTTNVTQSPRTLRLVKTGYSAVLSDDELVYRLTARNTSDTTAHNVTLLDVLPTHAPLVGASPMPDEVSLPLLRWSLGDLAPGARRTIVVTTTAPASLGVITNTAALDGLRYVVTQTTFSTVVANPAAILRLNKHGSAESVIPGEQLIYTLNYENAGNEPVNSVRMTDTFPSGVTVNAAFPPPQLLTGQEAVWDLGTLEMDETGQVIVTTTVTSMGGTTLVNRADITGHPGSFPDHAELETDVRNLAIYLPFMIRYD
jgi:uncharacterized repeat protein (TIGR01451 family)